MLDRALKLAEAKPKSELMAEVLETLGLLRHYACAGRNDYAELPDTVEPLYKRALEIREAVSGENDVALARVLELNSLLLRQTGQDDQAKPLSIRSSAIRDQHIRALSPHKPWGTGPTADAGTPSYRIGGGVSPPSVITKREPEYSDLARFLKQQGTAVLTVVVTPSGVPDSMGLARSLGLGLDEQALIRHPRLEISPRSKRGQPGSRNRYDPGQLPVVMIRLSNVSR